MRLEQMFHSLESRLIDFGRRLCQGAAALAREEADDLGAFLDGRRARLERCRDDLTEARLRLRSHETRAARIASHIESYLYVYDGPSAWRHALELDGLRRQITEDRQELRRLLAEEGGLLDEVRALNRRLDDLQVKLGKK